MDADNYPTDDELKAIREWDVIGDADEHRAKCAACFDYIRANCWHFAEWGWSEDRGVYSISTGGWSGNEDVIEAMRENFLLWSMTFKAKRVGGHYVFSVDSDVDVEFVVTRAEEGGSK